MPEQRGSSVRGDHAGEAMLPAILWGIIVSLLVALVGALILATAMRLVESLRPTSSALLALMLAAVALGAMWSSHRLGRSGFVTGGLTGLGFGLLAWLLVTLMQLGPVGLPGVLQAVSSAAVVGAIAGIIGVNL